MMTAIKNKESCQNILYGSISFYFLLLIKLNEKRNAAIYNDIALRKVYPYILIED